MARDLSFLSAPHRPLLDTAALLAALEAGRSVRIDAFALWTVDSEPVDCEAAAQELMDTGRAHVVWTGHCRILELIEEY